MFKLLILISSSPVLLGTSYKVEEYTIAKRRMKTECITRIMDVED